MIDHLVHAARGLRRSPALTATVVATLALGNGATTFEELAAVTE